MIPRKCSDGGDAVCAVIRTSKVTRIQGILFNNQFTPDEVYDNYPADRLMHDIALALMAVQTQTTEVLDSLVS